MDNPFLKRLMKEKSQDVIHSSAYGEAQNSGKMGVASAQSFAARQAIEQSRSQVRGYRDSKIVTEEGNRVARAATFDAEKDAAQRAAIRERFGRERGEAGSNKQTSAQAAPETAKPTAGNPPAWRNPGISR